MKLFNNKIMILNIFMIFFSTAFSNNYIDLLIRDYYEIEVDKRQKPIFDISKDELIKIADKIFKNETGGKKENLVSWNSGESFPSLGIGHFIWEKSEGSNGIYGDSFRGLVDYYRKNDIELPTILRENYYSPWKNRRDFLRSKERNEKEIVELIDFLDVTRVMQVLYIFERLEASLEKMLRVSSNKENLKFQFYRVANSENGLYALIDYVNFKGEGIATSKAYRNNGWGLRQVLENMTGTALGEEALEEFSESAKKVLKNRVNNAPRNESQWLAGWNKRLETYVEKD